MAYLLLVIQNCGSRYNGTLLKDTDPMFDYFEEITRNLPLVDSDNNGTLEKGRLYINYFTSETEARIRTYGFRKCDVCGEWVTPQDIRTGASTWDGVRRLCPMCKARIEGDVRYYTKSSYHSTSNLVNVINGEGENERLDTVKGIGFEAEYWSGNSDSNIKCTSAFYNMLTCDKPLFRVENDCTVDGEIISNVFTKKALYAFDFKVLADVLVLNGNVDGNIHAGLHIHASKTWLGDTPKEQVLNFLKLQYFMKSYENDFLKLCGRDADNMYYCQFFSHSEIEQMKNRILRYEGDAWDYMPSCHGGCGCALNASGRTIEWRIGANTNDHVRMRNYILFIQAITENIKNVPFEKCYCIGKVTRLVPKDIMAYWRSKGCFLNTNANENRGVSL